MSMARVEHAGRKKIRDQHRSISSSEAHPHSSAQMLRFPNVQNSRLYDNNGSSESGRSQSKDKNKFVLSKLRGFGCKGMAMPVSATVQSATQQGTGTRRKKNHRKKSTLSAGRPTNLADTPDICCAPPGISYLSDVVPRPDMNSQRTTHVQHPRDARRNANNHNISASGSVRQYHHLYIRFTGGTIDDGDQYGPWRLNVDSMSYEELLDLGDQIGYANRGLSEKEIFHCLKMHKLSESVPLLISRDKDWRCSICQEGNRSDKEVAQLGCGHCHHISCIKQWLRQKNECPVCKIPPIVHQAWL